MARSPKQKHVPQRTCIVCRQKFDKRHLMRLVKTSEGIILDASGKRDGRGAYVCNNLDCQTRVASTDILSKALRTGLNDDDRQRLRELAQ
ncbi:MAG: YlxR family protein [Phototrophicaceae bacterium]